MTKFVRKIDLKGVEERLQADLEKYSDKALEFGASRAVVIKAADIPVDERVTLKCRLPRCTGYGTGAHCPPHALKPAELREALKQFNWAIFFTKDVPAEVIIRNKETVKERVAMYQAIFNIVNKIESLAFYDGHYLAVGFGAGSCRHSYCAKEETCRALEGGPCRFGLRARSSMEAVGIDVYRLITNTGWEIYPIGCGVGAEDVPQGILAGLVLVD